MEIVKTEDSGMQSYCCRICVTMCGAQYRIQDRTTDHEKSLSVQLMLEKLFPAVFNPEQVERDRKMQWPSTICPDCRSNVLSAYALYERCEKSVDLLHRQQFTAIGDDVPRGTAMDEQYIPEKLAVAERQESDPNSLEVESPLELTVVETVSKLPRTVRSSKRTSLNKRQNIVSPRTKRKQTKRTVKQFIAAIDAKQRPHCDGGDPSDEKCAANCSAANEPLQSSSSTVINCKGERDIPLRESIDVSEELQADANELETKIDLYQCVLCNAPTYSSPKAFTEHLKENHPDQIRTCEHCPKVFVTQTAFEQHLYCHATGRSFFCTFCDKGFQTEQLLKNHIRTHTHRSNYLCFHCGKEFNNNSNLRQHIIGHSGHKPWACNLCPCRFSTKGGLTTHQNTHTKEKAFSCDTCGSQFNKHYSLIKHKLIHTGERPFGCEVCGMRFATSYMVKRHMRTHTGEKPFKCTYCDRSFAQSNDMVKHMKIHVGSNPYQCDRCDATFRLLSDLRNHYKEHYQTGELGVGGAADQDKGMRFTSIDILQLRLKKQRIPPEGKE